MESETQNSNSKVPVRRTRKRVVFLRFILAIFTLFIIAAVILWTQRLGLLEHYTKKTLSKQGITAEFSIRSLSDTQIIIDDVRLSSDGDRFLSLESVSAQYVWQDALEQKFERIEITGPRLKATIDGQGNIIDPWAQAATKPQANETRAPVFFPPGGIIIRGGKVDLASPYGKISADIKGELSSLEQAEGQIKIHPVNIKHGDFSAAIGGDIDVKYHAGRLDFQSDVSVPDWSFQKYHGSDLTFKGPGSVDISTERRDVTGKFNAAFSSIQTPDIVVGRGQISWDGHLGWQSGGAYPDLGGNWLVDLNSAGIINDARRESLARSLTIHKTLSGISFTAPFAPEFLRLADGVLLQSAIKGQGAIKSGAFGTKLYVDGPIDLSNADGSAAIKPAEDGLLYEFDRKSQNLTLSFDAYFNGKRPVRLEGAQMTAVSETGRDIVKVTRFATGFVSGRTIFGKTADGRAARLAPLNAHLDYRNDGSGDTNRLAMTGKVDYDGSIPGGYATGLIADGDVHMKLGTDRLSAKFTPRANTPITIASVDSVPDWQMQDLQFSIVPGQASYTREKGAANALINLESATGRMAHVSDPQDFNFELGAADIAGDITGNTQTWTVKASDAHMISDTLPSPGTDIRAPDVTVTAQVKAGQPLYFTIDTESADVKTQLVSAEDLWVKAKGTPADIDVEYGNGVVEFSAGELPRLPMTGNVNFENGTWAGTAETFLPGGDTVPIDVSYRFERGIGSADVVITDLPFTPSGLQPQQFISALRGKVADVEGRVSSRIKLSFGADQPLTSSGTATLKDMKMGTLPGPLKDVNADLTFSSFFPLRTDGVQTLKLGSFDPGLPLLDGEISFEVIPDGVNILGARWPLGTGSIQLDPTTWLYSAPENEMMLRVKDVAISEFLRNAGDNLKMTGQVNGELPITIRGVSVTVDEGSLRVEDGGVIEFQTKETDAAAEVNEYAGYAFEALKKLNYKSLEIRFNGPLDGDIGVYLEFAGTNPDVLYGSEFLFRVNIEGELMNILRSLQTGGGWQDSFTLPFKNSDELETTER